MQPDSIDLYFPPIQIVNTPPKTSTWRARKIKTDSSKALEPLIRQITASQAKVIEYSKPFCDKINGCADFREALTLTANQDFSPNEYIYSSLLKKVDSFESLQKLFYSIPDQYKNSVIYNIYIISCGDFQQFQEAEKAFHSAMDLKIADPFVFGAYFIACGATGNIQIAMDLFENCSDIYLDDFTIATYIKSCGECGEIDEIEKGLEKAKKLNCLTSFVLDGAIKAYGINQQFLKAKEVFLIADKDAQTLGVYLDIAGSNGKRVEAKNTLNLAIKLGLATPYHFSIYINYADFDEATAAYAQAQDLGHANEIVRSCYIRNCGKNKKFPEGEKVYQDTYKSNPVTFSNFIYACGKCGEMEKAKKSLELAGKLQLLNEGIFNSYLKSCINNNRFEEGRKAFTSAFHLGYANAPLFHQYFQLSIKQQFAAFIANKV